MNQEFKEKADKYIPIMHKTELMPVRAVQCVEDSEYWQSTKVIEDREKEFYDNGDSICLDFGRHVTGHFSFELGQYINYIDAPVRLKIKFAETPYEMRVNFDEYEGGLCASWLQEEIITVDLKGRVYLPRRYSFRYVELTVLHTRQKIVLKNFVAEAYTSAELSNLVTDNTDGIFGKIDKVSADTLSECMQDFFEDGPKRDRRLWLGDLRLQALTNYYTFKNVDLVKRCLYLFAAFDSEERLLPACLYTKPELETGGSYLVSYALLFVVSLCDYFEYTNDRIVTEDLFDTAARQIEITKRMKDENGIVIEPENYGWWTFIDWSDAEDVTANMGIYIYTVKKFAELCSKLGREKEAKAYEKLAEELKTSALEFLYDGNIFKNKYDHDQYSVQSQVWMILAEVVSKTDAQRILNECIENEKYIAPVTPYMHHYVVEALIKAELYDEAKRYIKDYWGGMVNFGADTFWEVFVKNDPYRSPYGDALMNSSCHAWSCTPAYFIRKYGKN